MSKRSPPIKGWLLVAIAASPAVASSLSAGAGDLKKAEAAAEVAKKRELEACESYDSYAMAHAATREIARAERGHAAAALKDFRAVETRLRQAADSGRAEADLRSEMRERLTTLRAATDRMIADSTTASEASAKVLAVEQEIRNRVAASRAAERRMLELKAETALPSSAGEAAASRRAMHEVDAVAALERQQWPALRRLWAQESVDQAGEAARVARDIASVESDAARKLRLEQFAVRSEAFKADAAKVVAEAEKAQTAVSQVYPSRAAALDGLTPLAPQKFDYAKARHLLVRAGFGGTPQEVEKLRVMGLYKAVDFLVEYYRQPAPSTGLDPVPPLGPDPLEARMTVRTMSTRVAGARLSVERGLIARLRQSWLQRMVESPRPLQEKLTLFWHGHFAAQNNVVDNSYIMFRQNQLFREHAAGSFAALLYGIVHDPAMIRYLDNNKNVKGDPNENLAREIMELFTMGVDQGYTEKDIIEAARALTGYTYDDQTGGFRFDYAKHDTGLKTIFGKSGPWTGDDLVRLILEQEATARFISRKLWEYFAWLDPDTGTIDRLASVLRLSNYELSPLLKNLFLSEEFYGERAMAALIKSPAQLVVGTLRDLGVRELSSYGSLDSAIQQMGQQLFEPPDVKGWRYGRSWISSNRLFRRYNSVAELVKSAPQPRGVRGVDVVGLLEKGGCPRGCEAVDYLARACLMRPLAEAKRRELTEYLGDLPPPGEWAGRRAQLNEKLRGLMVLMLSTPEYQLM